MALVLGAGGPVGYAFHAGVLAALAAAGWDGRGAEVVVGTSIGAVVAGLLRAGMPPADLHARVVDTALSAEGASLLARAGGWPSFPAPSATGAARWGRPASPALLSTLARHPGRVRPGLLLAGLTNAGTVDTAPIEDAFDRVVGERWPDPVTWICAVDLDSGERATFGSPSAPVVGLGRAVAASCAVPSYFAPVEVAGRRYVDGGVRSPANTDLVRGRPGAVVVSLPMGMAGPPGRRGVDLPGRRLNSKGAAAGLRPLVVAGVPVLVVEPTAAELAVMHYDAFDNAHLGDVAARSGATLAARIRRRLPADAAALAALGI